MVGLLADLVFFGQMDHLHGYIRCFPKCELHVHIEGTLEAEQLRVFAARNNILLPDLYADQVALAEAYASFNNLQEFLDLYYQGVRPLFLAFVPLTIWQISVLREARDFQQLAEAYFKRAQHDRGPRLAATAALMPPLDIRHAEIFFDPQAHTSRGVPFETGMTVNWIMCFLRDMPEDSAMAIFDQALPYLKSGQLLGIGLDSAEAPHPPIKFQRVYRKAREAGVRCVAHAGEEGGCDFVWSALRDLGVERIDHGIRSIEDPSLLAHMAAERIPLTVCPVSNVALKVSSRLEDVPLRALLDAGVMVTLNSDDPACPSLPD
jgi:adenosine deaminase